MRAIAGSVILALLVLIAPTSSAREQPTGEIVLRGNQNAYVDVNLRSSVKLTCCGIDHEVRNGRAHFSTTGFRASTDGTYAGFVIERLGDGQIMKGVIRVPEMDLSDNRFPAFVSFGKAKSLPAGRYRIHLLTDGDSIVRVQMKGLERKVIYRPQTPSRAKAALYKMIRPAGPPVAHVRDQFRVRSSSTVVLASQTDADLGQAHVTSHCLAMPGDWCKETNDYHPYIAPGSGASGMADWTVYPAGSFGNGDYEAVFTIASAGIVRSAHGFILVFE